jgi:penicillin amidase
MSDSSADRVAGRRRGRLRRATRWALIVLSLAVVSALAAALWAWLEVRGSLPQLDGQRVLSGLDAPVRVERDAQGVPRIVGKSRRDVARATGFVHAQERFFQMDLLRRRAAGELAELAGSGVLNADREIRVHRFRELARRVIAAAQPADRILVEAYAEGVNTGLASLGAVPFEYLVLREAPVAWRPEDSVLVLLAMFIDLQGGQDEREAGRGLLHATLPAALAEFLDPPGSEWDAPISGGPLISRAIPGPEVVDLRSAAEPRAAAASLEDPRIRRLGAHLEDTLWERAEEPILGSNNWAVAGAHTSHGVPLLADDMHLGLGMPNVWYRASLAWSASEHNDAPKGVTGVMLPGTPSVVVGSNGQVAWGFTNSEGDWSDLVVLDPDPSDSGAYLTPGGPRRFERVTEHIRVKDGPEFLLRVRTTIWGPVVGRDHSGRERAHSWVAHRVDGVNLGLASLEATRSLAEAQRVAALAGIPAQNFVAVDREGHIGWTIAGRIPRRRGFDGSVPESWADGTRGWDGWLEPELYPRVVDPPSGRIWTANARVVGGDDLGLIGDGGYDLGARARQIRDDLLAIERASESDLLAVQLDDRALFLTRWQELLLRTLGDGAIAQGPRRAEMRRLVAMWGGRASVESVGYRLVRAFRLAVARDALGALTAPCRQADPRFDALQLRRWEAPLWALVTERPSHMLAPAQPSWDALLLAAADAALAELTRDGSRLAELTWGRHNTVVLRHPLSGAVPVLGRWIDLPPERLPGDSHMPRAQSPRAGASERMVVAPGREAEGIFHMPGGQSGHPLSAHYRDGHGAWSKGEAKPFLPGPSVHVLTLVPAVGPGTR